MSDDEWRAHAYEAFGYVPERGSLTYRLYRDKPASVLDYAKAKRRGMCRHGQELNLRPPGAC